MEVPLAEWLGRFEAERCEPAFVARGLTTVQLVCEAGLSDSDLTALGVDKLWQRSALLSGVIETAREASAMQDEGWADFGDDGGGGGGGGGGDDLLSFAEPSPEPQPTLGSMLGDDAWSSQEQQQPSFSLSFDVVAEQPKPGSPGRQGGGMVDLFVGDSGESTTQARPRYRVAHKAVVRAGFEANSTHVGGLAPGDVFTPLEERLNEEGISRVRFAGGWLSKTTADGTVALEPTDAAETTAQATSTAPLAQQPPSPGLRLEPAAQPGGVAASPAERHADQLLSGIDMLLAELGDDDDDSPLDPSRRASGFVSPTSPPGIGGGSPASAASPPQIGSPLGSPPQGAAPTPSSGGEYRDALGRLAADGTRLVKGSVSTSASVVRAIDGKLGGHGEQVVRGLDERLAVGETARLVAGSIQEKREAVRELDESYHLTEKGKEGVRKGLAVSSQVGKAGMSAAAPVASRAQQLTMDGLELTREGIDLTREQLKALRAKIMSLRDKEQQDESAASRLEALETMFRRSPRAAAAALAEAGKQQPCSRIRMLGC